MQFNEYQTLAANTAIYPHASKVTYPALGLCGEAGEVAEKVKKNIRDGASPTFKEDMKKELGDVLWYISALARDLDIDLDTIAQMNLQKLKDRQERNQIQGSGDNR
jgi:NTP pyrophosphatase (non-canonical NTP hydrolase)|tara:strand:- start:5349 stop:5666 length:318 start_codon:yes stop_codon:yes gene_type:complete